MSAFLFTILASALGALVAGAILKRRGRGLRGGMALGAVAGLLGSLAAMIPLQYCVLDPEHHMFFKINVLGGTVTVNAVVVLGVLLVIVVAWAFALAIDRLRHHWGAVRGSAVWKADTAPGTFIGYDLTPWIFLAPIVVGLAVFTYYPAAQNFFLGTQIARRGVAKTAFNCLDNFASLITSRLQDAHYFILSDGFIWHAENARYLAVFGNSLFFSVFIVIVANVLGLSIALLASQKIRGASIYRTLMIWPYAISGVVVGIVFAILLGGGGSGFLNQVLQLLGFEPLPFLSDPWWARVAVGAAAAWNKLGFNMLIYIAALQAVPMELMEAASIDGANAWKRFLHVTIPMISPYIFFVVFLNLNYSFFDLFAVIENLTEGGPVNATTNLVVDIIRVGVEARDIGKAAAQSIVLFMVVIGLTYIQFRVMGRRVTYGAD
ncbi:MAG: sugar ABC transporter permease [Chloroflexi bacterium]|nr:sugar ABC transporter permease [Chloroflexota bacterium]